MAEHLIWNVCYEDLRKREKGLTLNQEKYKFQLKELVFMGHKLSDKGISTDKSKVDTVLNATTPTNAAEVKFPWSCKLLLTIHV